MFPVNALKNLRVPVPVDPDDAAAGTRDVTGDHILSQFIHMARDIAKIREATEYSEDASYGKRNQYGRTAAAFGGGAPLVFDPVPQGETWEVVRVVVFFPASVGVAPNYGFIAYNNAATSDQVIGGDFVVDNLNGVAQLHLPIAHRMKQGEQLIVAPLANTADNNVTASVWFKSVHTPVLMKEIV